MIYDRGGSAFAKIQPGHFDWDRIFAGKQWFHWSGTAPALGANVAAVTREACQAAKRRGLTVSCDLNYRRKLWTPAQARKVMTGLMPFVDVLIGGRGDASRVLGVEAAERNAVDDRLDVETHRAVARELHHRFGFRLVATTLRESLSASENNLSCLLRHRRNHRRFHAEIRGAHCGISLRASVSNLQFVCLDKTLMTRGSQSQQQLAEEHRVFALGSFSARPFLPARRG